MFWGEREERWKIIILSVRIVREESILGRVGMDDVRGVVRM